MRELKIVHFGLIADNALGHRTVENIQGKVTKESRRNGFTRFVRARVDKDKIAAWKSELNRILTVFNVGSVKFAGLSLIVPFSD
jgi:hypothetical protein